MIKPNKKKATNRDVAKLAGVSVATVSYVINGREDQHISEETKKKVLHAINFLNYIPNPHAVGLNTPQPQTIIIRSSSSVSPFTESEILFFMHAISPICQEHGYQLNYSMDKRAERLAANACICFDMPNEEFHALSNENFIPVIAIDSLINDPVFYQITIDYGKVYSAAEQYFGGINFTYCCIEPQNMQLKEDILSHFECVVYKLCAGYARLSYKDRKHYRNAAHPCKNLWRRRKVKRLLLRGTYPAAGTHNG